MNVHRFVAVAVAAIVWAVAIPALAQVVVGGAPMYANKDIVDNAVNSKDHTTLVAAVKAADLVATLKGPGPFTVFAPTNAAFAALAPATLFAESMAGKTVNVGGAPMYPSKNIIQNAVGNVPIPATTFPTVRSPMTAIRCSSDE